MIAMIDEKREELFALCRQFNVRRLEVFGSAATGEFVPGKSDIDFLVIFDRPEGTNAFRQYFGFRGELEQLYGCDIDLVCTNAMKNPYFIASVNESRRPVYGA